MRIGKAVILFARQVSVLNCTYCITERVTAVKFLRKLFRKYRKRPCSATGLPLPTKGKKELKNEEKGKMSTMFILA